jgi:cellulose synthase/poly-beta-1,6-N-acetylglucosamine synthase-like glycosyltransferase
LIILALWIVLNAVICLPSANLLFLTVSAFRARKVSPDKSRGREDGKIAFVIPAHNEETVIGRTIANLIDISDKECAIHMVADNCTDTTAAVGKVAGANVFERFDNHHKSKGHALAWLIPKVINFHLKTDGTAPLAITVVDADGTLSPGSVDLARAAFLRGDKVLQSEYILDQGNTPRSRVMAIAFAAINVVRGLGRSQLGLADTLKGNGMWFRTSVLVEYPWRAFSLAEDLEFGLMLRRSGVKICHLPGSVATGLPGQGDAASSNQRARWESGRLALVVQELPRALGDLLKHPSLANGDLVFEMVTPPLTFYALILTILGLSNIVLLLLDIPASPALCIDVAAILALKIHLVSAIPLAGFSWRAVGDLAGIPLFVLWKIIMLPRIWRDRKSKVWIRTDRH